MKFRIWSSLRNIYIAKNISLEEVIHEGLNSIEFGIMLSEEGNIYQQYTDLCDRYSNLIYEGDIVFSPDDQESYEVVSHLGMFCVKHQDNTFTPLYEYPEVQIIGNIFEP